MPRPTYVNANVERAYYNNATPIAWLNSGGDWWDAAYTANGSTPWASQTVVDTDTPREITFNVTTLFQAIYDNPNHLSAVIVCGVGGTATEWVMADNADTAKRPKINYDGGADIAITEDTGLEYSSFAGFPTATLRNVTPDLGTSTYFRIILNVPPPVTRPTSATLKLYTTAQFGNVSNQVFWLRYPPESAPTLPYSTRITWAEAQYQASAAPTDYSSPLSRGIFRGIERGVA